MEASEYIGKKIRQLRGDMSLRDFALKCDVSHTTIDNLEKGIDFRTGKPSQVKMATLQKIANACNVPVSYIISDTSPALSDATISENKRKLIEWAKTVPEDKIDAVLQAMQSILAILQ